MIYINLHTANLWRCEKEVSYICVLCKASKGMMEGRTLRRVPEAEFEERMSPMVSEPDEVVSWRGWKEGWLGISLSLCVVSCGLEY